MKNPPDFPSCLPLLEAPRGKEWQFRGEGWNPGVRIPIFAMTTGQKWSISQDAIPGGHSNLYYAELVEIPIPTPAEPDYNSLHYRAYVEAAFAGGLRVENKSALDDDWCNGFPHWAWDSHIYRIHPEDADKEPDYSSKSYQRQVLLAAFDGVPCEYFSLGLKFWTNADDISIVAAALNTDWKIRIAPPIKPQPAPPRMVPLGISDLPCGAFWVMYGPSEGHGNQSAHLVVMVNMHGVSIIDASTSAGIRHITFVDLMNWSWSRTVNNPEWTKCEKEAK